MCFFFWRRFRCDGLNAFLCKKIRFAHIWQEKWTGSTDGWEKNLKGFESIIITWYSVNRLPSAFVSSVSHKPYKILIYTSLNIFNHICAKLESTGYFEDHYSHHISVYIWRFLNHTLKSFFVKYELKALKRVHCTLETPIQLFQWFSFKWG